jgi:hypothetical protein
VILHNSPGGNAPSGYQMGIPIRLEQVAQPLWEAAGHG